MKYKRDILNYSRKFDAQKANKTAREQAGDVVYPTIKRPLFLSKLINEIPIYNKRYPCSVDYK